MNEPAQPDQLQVVIDKVANVKIDPSKFPHDPPLQFRHAAVNLLTEIARLRFRMDGGDLKELDDLDLQDETVIVDLNDLREFIAAFHAEGNQRSYAACAAVFDWATATQAEIQLPANNN
jgi:hypothetical protein